MTPSATDIYSSVGQSEGLMQFAINYPAVMLLIVGLLFAFATTLAWKLYSNHQTSLNKAIVALGDTVIKLDSSVNLLGEEAFRRITKLERRVDWRDGVCETMGKVCPSRKGVVISGRREEDNSTCVFISEHRGGCNENSP